MSKVKLHLGCGKRDFGSDWIHIDGGDFPHLHSHDVTKLPFEDNSVDLIYASHLLEYFDREEAVKVLSEWRRVLKYPPGGPGGILRLAVPDFETMVILYLWKKEYKLESFLGPLYGKMNMETVHMEDNRFKESKTVYHKTTYDLDSLTELLESVGMENIHKYSWKETEHSEFDDQSQAFLPHMDKEKGILISLNVECTKKL